MCDQKQRDFAGILADPSEIAQFISDRIDTKIAWYREHRGEFDLSENRRWQDKVLDVIYRGYLKLKFSEDRTASCKDGEGRVLCKDGDVLIIEWKCDCPILKDCVQTGWHTSHVCSTLYHCQWQALLSLIEPGAFFARDYSKLRPEGGACIEIITRRPGFSVEIEKAWRLVRFASAVSKPLLWLRDADSPLPLGPDLLKPLRGALRTVVEFPNAVSSLCDKMTSIYDRALTKPWVGIGAQPRSSRLGRRTAEIGLIRALDHAKNMRPAFDEQIASVKQEWSVAHSAWDSLFSLTGQFIDNLDWGEFVIDNARGQASNLVLESLELLEAISHQKGNSAVAEEIGDVFYNLMACCLSLRIGAQDVSHLNTNGDTNRPPNKAVNPSGGSGRS